MPLIKYIRCAFFIFKKYELKTMPPALDVERKIQKKIQMTFD